MRRDENIHKYFKGFNIKNNIPSAYNSNFDTILCNYVHILLGSEFALEWLLRYNSKMLAFYSAYQRRRDN